MDLNNPLLWILILGVGSALVAAGKWIGGMDEFRRDVRDTLKTIEENIKDIFHLLQPEAIGGSPLRLTDFGRSISEDVGGSAWASETASRLLGQLRDKEAFEVHEYASEYVQDDSHFTEEFLRKMRECAYNRAAKPEQVRNVLSIELRDALLKNLS